jgi:hypothetical protein
MLSIQEIIASLTLIRRHHRNHQRKTLVPHNQETQPMVMLAGISRGIHLRSRQPVLAGCIEISISMRQVYQLGRLVEGPAPERVGCGEPGGSARLEIPIAGRVQVEG